jgi:hypothetical protein
MRGRSRIALPPDFNLENLFSTRGLAELREFAIIRDLLERWMSGLSRTPGKRV